MEKKNNIKRRFPKIGIYDFDQVYLVCGSNGPNKTVRDTFVRKFRFVNYQKNKKSDMELLWKIALSFDNTDFVRILVNCRDHGSNYEKNKKSYVELL